MSSRLHSVCATWSRRAASEERDAELRGSVVLHRLRRVLIQVGCDPGRRVPEPLRHDLQRHSLLEERRRRRVAQIMQADPPDLGHRDEPIERLAHGARVYRDAGNGREDEVTVATATNEPPRLPPSWRARLLLGVSRREHIRRRALAGRPLRADQIAGRPTQHARNRMRTSSTSACAARTLRDPRAPPIATTSTFLGPSSPRSQDAPRSNEVHERVELAIVAPRRLGDTRPCGFLSRSSVHLRQ